MTQRELQVGDRVKVIEANGFWHFNVGKIGNVTGFSKGATFVKFENGDSDFGRHSALQLIPLSITLPSLPESISVNGVTFRPAEAAAVAEEKPEVKAGQVWEWLGNYVVIGDEKDKDGDWKTMGIGGNNGRLTGMLGYMHDGLGVRTFIAPSLHEALSTGKLTLDDLR